MEKRREMKSDGRTDKELMESYCFLLADALKVSRQPANDAMLMAESLVLSVRLLLSVMMMSTPP